MNETVRDTCFPNLTVAEAIAFQKKQTKVLFLKYRYYFAHVPLPLILTALVLTVIFAIAAFKAMKYRCVSRKCYLFILNRAVGDVLCCLFYLSCAIYLLVISADNFSVSVFIVLVTLCGGCLWTAMVSYVSLSLLKLYAVYNPLNYRSAVTTRSWVVYILMIFYTLTVTAMAKLKHIFGWTHFSSSRSMYIMSRSKDIFFVAVYLVTIIVFLLTVVFIRRGRKFMNSLKIGRSRPPKSRFPFWKLSLNVFIFAVVNFAFVYMTFVTIFFQDACYWKKHRDRRTVTIGVLRCVLVVRIIVDAIVGFIIDPKLRTVAISMFCLEHCVSNVSKKLTWSGASAETSSASDGRRRDSGPESIRTVSLQVHSK